MSDFMATVKERIIEIIQAQPDDAGFDDNRPISRNTMDLAP